MWYTKIVWVHVPDWGKSVGSVAPNNHSSFDFSPAMPFHDFPGDMGSAVGKCPWSRPPSKPWASEQEWVSCILDFEPGIMITNGDCNILGIRESHKSYDKGNPAVSYKTMHHECIIYESSTKSQIWRPRIWGKVPQVPWLTLGSPQATTG